MAAADVSAITYFAPIAAFLIVFIFVYYVLKKTELVGDKELIMLLVAFLVAAIFVSVAGARTYITTVVPWFAVLIVSLIFLLAITGFIGEPTKFMNKGIGIVFVIILAIVFLLSGFFIFSNLIVGYLPGPMFGYNVNPDTLPFLDWLYSPRIAGALLLIITSAVVSWILVKAK